MSSGWQWHVGDSNYFCLLRPTRRRELQGLAILFYNSRWNYSPGNTTRVPLWTALYMALTSYKFSLNSFSYWNTFVRHESLAYQKGIRYPPHILYFLHLRRTNGDSTELNIISCLDKLAAIGTWSHLTWDSSESIVAMLHYRDRVLYKRVRYSIVAMLHYIDRVLYEIALPCIHLTILIFLLISYKRKHISCQCCWSIWTVARLGRVYLTAIPKVH